MSSVPAALAGACYSPSYAVSRARFLLAAAQAGARVDTWVHPQAGAPDGGSLATDVAVLGPPDAPEAALVVSGTHGPEGFMGAAAQIALLHEIAGRAEPPPVRIVLVHAINPWGFAHVSRTTEHNVDLNRNFVDWSAAAPVNEHYAGLHDALCPPDVAPETLGASRARLEAWSAEHGQDAFADATMRGQYTHPEGLNYGGTGPEWSHLVLRQIVERHLASARRIGLIDWHTALGERAQPFFLCFNERGGAAWQRACRWWGTDRIETTGGFGGAGRPRYTGLLFHGVGRFAPQAELTGAVIEFGTLPRDQVRRALQLDRALKFGAPIDPDALADAREQVLEAFCPQSPAWRQAVLGHAIDIQHRMLAGLQAW
jgi:hypothetical protein